MSGMVAEILREYVFMLPVLAVLEAVMLWVHKKKGYRTPIGHVALLNLFLVGIYGMIYVTGAGTVGDIINWRPGIISADQINLIPFRWGIGDLYGFGMNIVLFIPLGFLLPFLWRRFDSVRNTVLAGFLFSLVIELSQLLNFRATDIDDLMTNTLGTLIGYGIYRLFGRKLAGKLPVRACKGLYSRLVHMEGAVWIVIVFLCNFFIMPFVRKALWGIFF